VLKMALSVAALGVASVLMMSAAAQDRGLNDRMASVESMRDLGKPAARPRNRSVLEQHAATNCHCWAQAGNYNGCYPVQDCKEIRGICKGDC
jgi:hypothetical protein